MKISEHLFDKRPVSGNPQPGKLLVAEPFLREYYFNHSVILLLEHNNEKETMGFVMNRKTPHTLKEVLTEGHNVGVPDGIPLFCGGPVACDRLFYLHKIPELIRESVEIGHGLYYGGDFSDVLEYLRDGLPTAGLIRFFAGYSGWNPGQLNDELESGTWAVENVPEGFNLLEGEEASYWTGMVRNMDKEYSGWLLQPMNPSDN